MSFKDIEVLVLPTLRARSLRFVCIPPFRSCLDAWLQNGCCVLISYRILPWPFPSHSCLICGIICIFFPRILHLKCTITIAFWTVYYNHTNKKKWKTKRFACTDNSLIFFYTVQGRENEQPGWEVVSGRDGGKWSHDQTVWRVQYFKDGTIYARHSLAARRVSFLSVLYYSENAMCPRIYWDTITIEPWVNDSSSYRGLGVWNVGSHSCRLHCALVK